MLVLSRLIQITFVAGVTLFGIAAICFYWGLELSVRIRGTHDPDIVEFYFELATLLSALLAVAFLTCSLILWVVRRDTENRSVA